MPTIQLALAGIALTAALSLTSACGGSQTSDVTVVNGEDVPLFALYFDPVGSDGSGTDLLTRASLGSGEQLQLPVECGTYDVIVQVAGGDQPPDVGHCLIAAVDVCADGDTFVIDASNCQLGE